MSVLADTHPTLLDLARRSGPDGKVQTDIVELLTLNNEILEDMTWVEGNLPTGHRTTVRTGLPTVTWRKLYGGVQPSKSKTAQITDNTGMLEAYAEIDKALADLNGNTAAWRMTEEAPFRESLAQEVATNLFYGNEGTAPEKFTGLAPRYNSLSAQNAYNIVTGGSSDTDNMSIWLVGWGPNTVHGIVPKGSIAGIQMKDLGEVTIENVDGNGGRMQAYRSHYRWDVGLTVRDWRYIVRICNIDRSALTLDAATGANLPNLMFQAMMRMQSLNGVRPVWYMDRTAITYLATQSAAAVKNSTLRIEELGGVLRTSFGGIPIKRVDALAGNEALVS